MTVKPTLAYLKAQIRRLGLPKKEEILKFLTDDISQQKATGQKSKEPSIDDYVKYYPNFISKEDTVLMEGISADLTTLGLKSSNINKNKIYTKWLGNGPYSYGNVHHPANPLDAKLPFIKDLMERVRSHPLCEKKKYKVHGCLVGRYPSGKAFIPPHADNESNIDQDSAIFTISIGADREVDYLQYSRNTVLKSIVAEDCSWNQAVSSFLDTVCPFQRTLAAVKGFSFLFVAHYMVMRMILI